MFPNVRRGWRIWSDWNNMLNVKSPVYLIPLRGWRSWSWKQQLELTMYIYMYTWILLIVEISTPKSPKPKSITFAKFRKKELLHGYFHSRHFFHTPERFLTVLNAFLTLFERFFPLRTSEVSRTAKTTLVFFFSTPTKSTFFGFGIKNSCVGRLQAWYFLGVLAHLTP